MKLPKAAIVGMGFMGPTHIQALRRLGIPVTGVLASNQEEGQTSAKRLYIDRAYRDYEELLADKQVAVVHICTPNYLHYPMAEAALHAGKHVICEKPLAMSTQESAKLMSLANQKNLIGVVNYNLRFYPICHEARHRVKSGETGVIRLIDGAYIQDWLALTTDWNWRLDPAEGGNLRAVADIGTHWLDMMTWLTGLEVQAVFADFATFLPTRYKPKKAFDTFSAKIEQANESEPVSVLTEDAAHILLRFNNGARGSLTLSQVSPGRKNYFWWEIAGSKASMHWDQEDPNHLWLGYRDQLNQILVKDPSLMGAAVRPFAAFPGGHGEGYPDTFYQLFNQVYSALIQDKNIDETIVPTFKDGHRELILCEAIEQSAHKERWINIETIDYPVD